MGLMSDTKKRQKLISLILHHHQQLSVLFYVVGLVWFIALAYQPLNAGTYFSENALLPGLVESDLPPDFASLYRYANALKVEMKKDKKTVPKEWIYREFESLGLETYRHNFTVKYPFKMTMNQELTGENIYAILRARRTASTEALVMTAPLRPANTKKTQTDGGIALMLGLAEQFRRNPYWGKDIIFLLTDFEEVGVHAWLNAYHETKSQYVMADELPGRSGAIQAAINLEIPGDKVRYLNLKIEGLNGQLPNLDLFNLAVRLGRREHVHVTFQHRADHHDKESLDGFQHSLGTMMSMMWMQASGAPSGNHGLFHRFHIEALTVEGMRISKGMRSYSLDKLAGVVEGIFRSLNNLLERFHQSFFFYLLPSTDRYVSIGLYMPPFGLMVAAGIIKISLALWILTHPSLEKDEENEKEDNEKEMANEMSDSLPHAFKEMTVEENDDVHEEELKKEDNSKTEDLLGGGDRSLDKKDLEGSEDKKDLEGSEDKQDLEGSEDKKDLEPLRVSGLVTVVPEVLMSFILGLMAYTAPSVLTSLTPSAHMAVEDSVLFGILAVFSAALAYPLFMNKKSDLEEHYPVDWKLLKYVALIVQGLTLFAVSLMNISLAFFLAALSLPVTMAVKGTNNWVLRVLQLIFLLIISPVVLLFMASIVNTISEHSAYSVLEIFWEALREMKQLMFVLLLDHYLFHSWTYALICFAVFPTWLVFWAIPFCEV